MSEEMWVIEGSLDSHDRVQRLLRGLVLSPAARRLTPTDILAAVRTLPGVEEVCECGVLKSKHRKSVMPHYKAASLVVPLSEEE